MPAKFFFIGPLGFENVIICTLFLSFVIITKNMAIANILELDKVSKQTLHYNIILGLLSAMPFILSMKIA